MNSYCYTMGEFADNTEPLLFERDGIWGYVSKNGEEIATFDDAIGFGNSEYAVAIQDGKSFLIDKQMNRVSEDIDCDFANSMSSELFFLIKDGHTTSRHTLRPGTAPMTAQEVRQAPPMKAMATLTPGWLSAWQRRLSREAF